MAKKLTSNKAKEILHDKSVHGHPLTDKQRRFFGAIAGGAPMKAKNGWLDKYDGGGQIGNECYDENGNIIDCPTGYQDEPTVVYVEEGDPRLNIGHEIERAKKFADERDKFTKEYFKNIKNKNFTWSDYQKFKSAKEKYYKEKGFTDEDRKYYRRYYASNHQYIPKNYVFTVSGKPSDLANEFNAEPNALKRGKVDLYNVDYFNYNDNNIVYKPYAKKAPPVQYEGDIVFMPAPQGSPQSPIGYSKGWGQPIQYIQPQDYQSHAVSPAAQKYIESRPDYKKQKNGGWLDKYDKGGTEQMDEPCYDALGNRVPCEHDELPLKVVFDENDPGYVDYNKRLQAEQALSDYINQLKERTKDKSFTEKEIEELRIELANKIDPSIADYMTENMKDTRPDVYDERDYITTSSDGKNRHFEVGEIPFEGNRYKYVKKEPGYCYDERGLKVPCDVQKMVADPSNPLGLVDKSKYAFTYSLPGGTNNSSLQQHTIYFPSYEKLKEFTDMNPQATWSEAGNKSSAEALLQGTPRYGIKPGSEQETKRLKDQGILKDEVKSFYDQWYGSPMHQEMLTNSLNRGLGLNLGNRVKNTTENRLNSINRDMDLRLDPLPQDGIFDISIAGQVKGDRPDLIHISPFSTLEGQKSTSIHEGAHVTDMLLGIPRKDIKLMKKYADFNKPVPNTYRDIYNDEELSDFRKYISSPTETRARIMNGRYELNNSKIYNPFKEKMTKEMFEKGEKENERFKDINDQLRTIYTDDQILDLYNRISKAENNQQQTMAKYGGQAGYTDKGFDYNSAWGGQFQLGGNVYPVNYVPQAQDGKTLTDEQLASLNRAKMRAKMALAAEFGNPSARRMMNPTPPSYRFSGNEIYNGKPVVGFGEDQAKLGDTGTHRMTSIDNFAVPYIQQNPNGTLFYNQDPSPKDREAIRFGNPQDAEYFAEHYKEVAPMMQNFAMGGSIGGTLPGSTGFTYARIGAPSNGPYAKKTKPSAEDGMTYYQHGLDWKPKTISEYGGKFKKFDEGGESYATTTSETTIPRYSLPPEVVPNWHHKPFFNNAVVDAFRKMHEPKADEVVVYSFKPGGNPSYNSMKDIAKSMNSAKEVQLVQFLNKMSPEKRKKWFADNKSNNATWKKNQEEKAKQKAIAERNAADRQKMRDFYYANIKPDPRRNVFDNFSAFPDLNRQRKQIQVQDQIAKQEDRETAELRDALNSIATLQHGMLSVDANNWNRMHPDQPKRTVQPLRTYTYEDAQNIRQQRREQARIQEGIRTGEIASVGPVKPPVPELVQTMGSFTPQSYSDYTAPGGAGSIGATSLVNMLPGTGQILSGTRLYDFAKNPGNNQYFNSENGFWGNAFGALGMVGDVANIYGGATMRPQNVANVAEDITAITGVPRTVATVAESKPTIVNVASSSPAKTAVVSNVTKASEPVTAVKNMATVNDVNANANVSSGYNPTSYSDVATAAEKTIFEQGDRILADLTSAEGTRRLKEQFRIADPTATDAQLDYLVQNRIREVHDALKYNRNSFWLEHGEGAPGTLSEGLEKKIFPRNNAYFSGDNFYSSRAKDPYLDFIAPNIDMFSDASYQWSAHGADPYNLNIRNLQFASPYRTPGTITLGPGYEFSPMAVSHEAHGHGLQGLNALAVLPLEDNLLKLVKPTSIRDKLWFKWKQRTDPRFQKDYDYFVGKTAPLDKERYPYLVENRETQKRLGIINDTYDQQNYGTLKAASIDRKLNPTDDNRLIGLFPSWKWKKLANIMNVAPATVPAVIGAGAIGKALSDDEQVTTEDELKQQRRGGVIKDNRGQWAYPGEITEIGSNRITMKGVPYPVLGISDTGHTQMMLPGQEYKFGGSKVTEFPLTKKVSSKSTGGWLDKYK